MHTTEHLARHGVTVGQAFDVVRGTPAFVDQQGRYEERPDGLLRWRRPRQKLIGPDRTGQLLTFVIEYPDEDGLSKIVTGWHADDEERAQYRQRRGGRNR